MKNSIIVPALLCSLLFTGCPARSINSLFHESETATVPDLEGTWSVEDETYTFELQDDKSYRVTYQKLLPSFNRLQPDDSIETTLYTIHAGKLGGDWFFDSYPADNEDNYHYLPTHLISKVWINSDTMFISFLEGDWLKKMIDSANISITHILSDNDAILTASTDELQRFVMKYSDNKEAFPRPGTFVRVR